MSPRVIIMRGLPGSGKSTWIKENHPDAMVCSADYYFEKDGGYRFIAGALSYAHGWCLRTFIGNLQVGVDTIIVDNTNIQILHMAPYVAVALAYGYNDIAIKTMPGDVMQSWDRNVHGVPLEQIQKMAGRWEELPPEWVKYQLP